MTVPTANCLTRRHDSDYKRTFVETTLAWWSSGGAEVCGWQAARRKVNRTQTLSGFRKGMSALIAEIIKKTRQDRCSLINDVYLEVLH